MSVKDMSIKLNKKPKAVRSKIERMGISLAELNRHEVYTWTDYELSFLKNNYTTMSDREIAYYLFKEDDYKASSRVFRKRKSLGLEKAERGLKYKYDNNDDYVRRYYKGNLIFEHRENAEIKLNRKLQKGEIVHHIDGDKRNNKLDNLCVLNDKKEHQSVHHQLEVIAMELVRKGVIKFNEEYKNYYIDENMLT
jgi:hypothetical protein